MLRRWVKWGLPAVILMLVVAAPASMAQAPSSVSLYSIWVRLSLSGLNQSEIESLMRNMDPKAIEKVKERLRATVISNLQAERVRQRYMAARDSDDLNSVFTSIDTELRFAGLQHDKEIRFMIRDHFGIRMEGR